MMMMGIHFMDEAPFRTVFIHGIVRDEKGAKMSKSKGNVVDPLELIDEFGADALRFTMASLATPGRDVKPTRQRIEGYRNFGTKIWNAARFCEMNECRPQPGFDPENVRQTVNRWALTEASQAVQAVTGAIEGLRFNEAADAIYHFSWATFCDWYVELIKPVLAGDDAAAKVETRATAAHVLGIVLRLLHPFMPYITEALWAEAGDDARPDGRKLLALSRWPDLQFSDAEASAEFNLVVDAISATRSVRSEMHVPPSARPTLQVVRPSSQARAHLNANSGLIATVARISGIEFVEEPSKGAAQYLISGTLAALPLAGIVDFEAEQARLEKEIARIEVETARIDKKLANEGFVARAPEDVVEAEREKRAAYAADCERLKAALKRLQDAVLPGL